MVRSCGAGTIATGNVGAERPSSPRSCRGPSCERSDGDRFLNESRRRQRRRKRNGRERLRHDADLSAQETLERRGVGRRLYRQADRHAEPSGRRHATAASGVEIRNPVRRLLVGIGLLFGTGMHRGCGLARRFVVGGRAVRGRATALCFGDRRSRRTATLPHRRTVRRRPHFRLGKHIAGHGHAVASGPG